MDSQRDHPLQEIQGRAEDLAETHREVGVEEDNVLGHLRVHRHPTDDRRCRYHVRMASKGTMGQSWSQSQRLVLVYAMA